MAAFYGVYHGPEGLKNIANRVHNMANNAGTPHTHTAYIYTFSYTLILSLSVSLSHTHTLSHIIRHI